MAMDIILSKHEIHVWHIDIHKMSYIADCILIKILSKDEYDRAISFKSMADKSTYLISHILLRMLISRYINVRPSEIAFINNKYGKPSIKNSNDLCFNLSHTYGKTVIAFSRCEVGIDIEYTKNFPDIEEMAEICFSKNERKLLENLDNGKKLKQFFTFWTRKEALLKAIGIGILDDLKEIDVSNLHQLVSVSDKICIKEWKIQHLNKLGSNYIGNLAYPSSDASTIKQFHDPSSLSGFLASYLSTFL